MSALRYRHIFQNQHCTAQCCIKCASVLWVPPEADLNGKEEFIQFEGPGPLLEEGMVKMVIVLYILFYNKKQGKRSESKLSTWQTWARYVTKNQVVIPDDGK